MYVSVERILICVSSVHQNPHRICPVRTILTERWLSYTPTQRTYGEWNAFINGIIYHFPTISISMQNLSTHKIMNKQLTKETQMGISLMFLTWFSAFPFWIFCSEHVWTFAMYTFFGHAFKLCTHVLLMILFRFRLNMYMMPSWNCMYFWARPSTEFLNLNSVGLWI